jgi:membrane dipeptidase
MNSNRVPIVDGHLDLAINVTEDHRDLEHKTPQEIRALEVGKPDTDLCMATLSEIRKGGIAIAFGTLFAVPHISWIHPEKPNPNGYKTPEEAEAHGIQQLAVYEGWHARGQIRLIKSKADLEHHLELWAVDSISGMVVLMEGADPIVRPSDVPKWWDRGVRIVGTSWGPTRYAGGTGTPTGLTPAGRELITALEAQGMIVDASHQSWEAFADTLEVGVTRLMASHSNTFALTPTSNRHLSDEMIREIGARDGMIGTVLYNAFLEHQWTREDPSFPVTLENQVLAHMTHVANLIGWNHVGIGSDIDGGLGRNETPEGLETIADLEKIGAVVPEAEREGVLGGNWLRFLRKNLP